MRQIYSLVLLFIHLFYINAQIPSYYDGIDFTSSPEVIKNELATLIEATHYNDLEYTPEVWEALKVTDLDPQDTTNRNVLLLYGYSNEDTDMQTDRTRDKDLNCTFTTGCSGYWNREHVYVRSLGTPNLGFDNAGADAHAIRACDSDMNSSRWNRKFAAGEGHAHITPEGYWYPGDEWIGDVARMMMYMYLRYPTQAVANNIAESPNTFHTDMPDIFLLWNAEDPVTEYEMQRNDYLNNIQGNRNPFIDNPFLATIIWGGDTADNTWQLSTTDYTSIELELYPNPSTDVVFYQTNETIKSIKVFSISGKLLSTDTNLNDNQVQLPQATGKYFLIFEGSIGTTIKRVIKK